MAATEAMLTIRLPGLPTCLRGLRMLHRLYLGLAHTGQLLLAVFAVSEIALVLLLLAKLLPLP